MRTLALATLAAALSLASVAGAQNFAGKPFLSVQGHAETRVRPDIFPIEATISDMSKDAAKSQALVENLAKQVLAAAQAQQVADVDVEIGNLSVSPETKYDDDTDQETFLGNTYERTIKVRFHSLDALRAFIGALDDSKSLKLQTRTFAYSKEAELKRQLRREAIADARRGAEDMAAAVGKRLVELQNVSDRAQSTVYSASGYNTEMGRVTGGYATSATLGSVSVAGSRRSSEIVLREGEIAISADAYLVYVMGD